MRGLPRFLFAAALITLLVVPAAASGQEGTDRPFKARLTGSVHWDFPGVSPSDCTIITALTDSMGQATHLGRVVASWSHCPADPQILIDGWLTITAANGDMLVGRYDFPTDGSNFFPVSWTGGTGRFARASGSIVVAFTVVPLFVPGCNPDPNNPLLCFDLSVPWPWSATATGTITY